MKSAVNPDHLEQQTVGLDPWYLSLLRRGLLAIIGLPVFLFMAYIPFLCRKRSGFRGWYWRFVKRSCTLLLRLLGVRTHISSDAVEALRHDSNSIIACNHRSLLDGFVLMDVIPDEKWFTFASKKELFDSVLLKTGFTAADLVRIDRSSGKSAMEGLVKSVIDMPKRRSAVMFVEGTRSATDSLGPFKAGIVVAARASGRKVCPIVIRHSDKLMPRGKIIPRSGTIEVHVLPSFECDQRATVGEDLARLRSKMTAVFNDK